LFEIFQTKISHELHELARIKTKQIAASGQKPEKIISHPSNLPHNFQFQFFLTRKPQQPTIPNTWPN